MFVKLYNDDCLNAMKDIEDKSVDMILCDLPYGTTSCTWDVVIPFEDLWREYRRILKPNGVVALFGQEPFSSIMRMSNLDWYQYDIYWEKERLTNIFQCKKRVGKTVETISLFYKNQPVYNPQMVEHTGPRRTNKVLNGKIGALCDTSEHMVTEYNDTGKRYPTQVWRFQRDCLTENLHPTQKPVALLEQLILTFTNDDFVVLDNTMGSGSTGVACINTGRNFIGIENDKKYFDVALERLSKCDGEFQILL